MESIVNETTSACSCSSGCGGGVQIPRAPYIAGLNITLAGAVPRVSTELALRDILGAWRVRWGFGRMHYTVVPGLYSIGKPDENSPVLVTANYKLTFDNVRKELTGLNLWLLVLDTKGVNVWCAAGKGTFGTDELVRRIEFVRLKEIVRHRTVIVPQLGATGVAAYEVFRKSGFHVRYGPVRAHDIKAFLDQGMKVTPDMRTVRFTVKDRIVLIPVDLIQWMKPLLILFGVLFILNAFGLVKCGLTEITAFLGAVMTGCVLTPVLLPWVPGRAFAFKGALLGVLWTIAWAALFGGLPQLGILRALSFFLLLPTVSAYTAMNFTGSSTYTSPSGVNKEMRIAIPIMLAASILGSVLFIASGLMKTIL